MNERGRRDSNTDLLQSALTYSICLVSIYFLISCAVYIYTAGLAIKFMNLVNIFAHWLDSIIDR